MAILWLYLPKYSTTDAAFPKGFLVLIDKIIITEDLIKLLIDLKKIEILEVGINFMKKRWANLHILLVKNK
jgi:hypothetical protein